MKLTFVTNYMNHHQLPLAGSLLSMLGEDYRVIETEPMEQERINMHWKSVKEDYIFRLYEDEETCLRILDESDVILYGGAEREDILERCYGKGKIILRYSERIYKDGQWKFLSPRGLVRKYKDYTRHNRDGVRLLCSGGYVSSDFRLVHAYPGMHYRFGYFPAVYAYTREELFARKDDRCLSLIWAGRMIDWKHPERALWFARKLKEENI